MTPLEFYKILEKQETRTAEQDTTPCYISSTFKNGRFVETSIDTLNPLSNSLYTYYNKNKENKQMAKSMFKRIDDPKDYMKPLILGKWPYPEEKCRLDKDSYMQGFYYDNMEVIFPSMKNNFLRIKTTIPTFERVIFNDPATIILWTDRKRYWMLCPNDKTVVKVHEGDTYDPEKGMIFAILKAYIPQYYKIIDIIMNHIKWDCSLNDRGELTVKKDIPEKFLNNYWFLNTIRHIIIDDQLTVIVWSDNTKTFVKCNESEYDLEKALGMAFCKKLFGNSFYRKVVKPEINKFYSKRSLT